MTKRRDFIRTGGVAVGALAASSMIRTADAFPLSKFAPPPANGYGALDMDPAIRDLLMEALNAAKLAGASFADARIGRYRQNFVNTRERQITGVVDTESMGCGVRALVDGTWGFAATKVLTKAGVASAAREAAAIAKANRVARDKAVRLAPAPVQREMSWKGAHKIDPWSIPVEEKADLLLRANAEALKVKGVQFVFSGLFFVKNERYKTLVSCDDHAPTRRTARIC
jgi:TldD protein